jgi:peptidoglycan/LPS O-acetylase OafA/YrhL
VVATVRERYVQRLVRNRSPKSKGGHSPQGRYKHIDALRAFAVMLVVVAHTDIGGIPGGSGVTIFFTISGFVICNLLIKERIRTDGFHLRSFYIRRFLKIAPPFFIVVVIPTFVFSFFSRISLDAFLLQIFFAFNWVSHFASRPIDVLPGSSVVWSLAIEEQFYIIFALFWLIASRSDRYLRILVVTASFAAVMSASTRVVYALNGTSENRISSGTDTRIEGIALGILLATLVQAAKEPEASIIWRWCQKDAALILAATLFLASLLIRDDLFRLTARYTVQSVSASIVILYGFASTKTSALRKLFNILVEARGVQIVGLASYSIYLAHAPVMRLMHPVTSAMPAGLAAATAVICGTGVGLIVWRFAEVPVVSLRERRAKIHEPL